MDDGRCQAGALPPHPGKQPGSRCKEFDGTHPGWATHNTPLCDTDLRTAERDTRMLVFDYIDLEQALPPSLGQALDTQSQYGQPGDPPAPTREHVEELQRTIWWITGVWAEALTERHRLSDPPTRVRDGFAVRWAVGVLAPRVLDLARLGPTEVVDYPSLRVTRRISTGKGRRFRTEVVDLPGLSDDEVSHFRDTIRATLTGADGVLHLSALHSRARSLLGRTRRTTHLPGGCSGCGAEDLRRDEPRYAQDPCDVYCGRCARRWSDDEYERYVTMLVWPTRVAA